MSSKRQAYELALHVLQEFHRVGREARRRGDVDVADFLDEVAYRQRMKVERLRAASGVAA
jgi:hypothetical protein